MIFKMKNKLLMIHIINKFKFKIFINFNKTRIIHKYMNNLIIYKNNKLQLKKILMTTKIKINPVNL